MHLTGSLVAPSSCLSCQLRQIVFRTRKPILSPCFNQRGTQHCRRFNTPTRRCQAVGEDEEDGPFIKSNKGDDRRRTIYRREYPLGRIVGQPGRRQREISETLKIDSMDRPFDVVLMQDVHEPKEHTIAGAAVQSPIDNSTISASQIASELLRQDGTPNQDEVDKSIDALRPDTDVVDLQQYKALVKQLSEGYNTQQLSSYLLKTPTLSPADQNDIRHSAEASLQKPAGLQISSWRPGRTPIDKRHSTSTALKRRERSASRKRLPEQIVRLAWGLSVSAEAEEVGELEMSLESWQFQYLFDLQQNNKPNYEHLVHPSILLRHSEILSCRPDKVMRIAARRRDAEEIMELVQRELYGVGKLELDLTIFKPMLRKPGWPKTLVEIFPESDLSYVGQHTMSVIERKDNKALCIYSRTELERQQAKRLLHSLLDLPSPTSIRFSDISTRCWRDAHLIGGRTPVLLPDDAGSGVHCRYRNLELSRLTIPTCRSINDSHSGTAPQPEPQPSQSRSETTSSAARLVEELATFEDFPPGLNPEALLSNRPSALADDAASEREYSSPWEFSPDVSPWQVQFCRIIEESDGPQHGPFTPKGASARRRSWKNKSALSTLQSDVPGINPLLSYFSPANENLYAFNNSPKPPNIIAHFFPSPFTADRIHALRDLPRLRLYFEVESQHDTAQPTDGQILSLSHVEATVFQQELRVSMPTEAVDLRFIRRISLTANRGKILENDEVMQFTETLRQSIASGSGALAGQPAIKIKLPRWIAESKSANAQRQDQPTDVEHEYVFERFEHVQTATFGPMRSDRFVVPVDPCVKQVLDGISGDSFLEFKTIEAGVVGGSRAELSLKCHRETSSTRLRLGHSDEQELQAKLQQDRVRLVEGALGLATCLTRMDRGTIQPLQTSQISTHEN